MHIPIMDQVKGRDRPIGSAIHERGHWDLLLQHPNPDMPTEMPWRSQPPVKT